MAAIGLLIFIFATTRSRFILYRLLVDRARILWGEGNAVHRYYQVCGMILFVVGASWALGVIWG